MILVIDNYDSFVFNLARYFQRLGQSTRVVRNDEITLEDVEDMNPRAIVLSPGPCGPSEAGRSMEVVKEFSGRVPILGICLGHQVIAAALGGEIVRSADPMHGRWSEVRHNAAGIFAGVPLNFKAGRYHSLVVSESSLPPALEVTAKTVDGAVMGIQHRTLPIVGLQFHPESVLTEYGYQLLENFLTLAGIHSAATCPSLDDELRRPPATPALPDQPVTF